MMKRERQHAVSDEPAVEVPKEEQKEYWLAEMSKADSEIAAIQHELSLLQVFQWFIIIIFIWG